MKVALEVSTIGLANLEENSGYNKTGIFRVTSELVEALLKIDEISISLLFWQFPYTMGLGHDFFLKNGHNVNTICNITLAEKFLYNLINKKMRLPKQNALLNVISKTVQKMRNFKDIESVDVIHSLYYPNPEIGNTKKNVRFITIHDLIPLKYPEFVTSSHYRQFLHYLKKLDIQRDWFFSVSEATKEDLCEILKVDEKRVIVNHLAASDNTFYRDNNIEKFNLLKKRIGLKCEGYFLSVATLEPRKNLQFILKCYKNVFAIRAIDRSIKLILVGRQGWMTDNILQIINSDTILKNNVLITGFLQDEDLRVLYSNAAGFIFPSLYEGFGLPVLEAMQCGSPVIASNTSSLPEVVGDSGILVDPFDKTEMCEAMICLISSESMRIRLSKKGIERAKQFSWEKCALNTVKAYKHALAGNGK